ncbi:MAG TPA: NAD-dependent deacylase [Nitrospira sp.]|nr:NAD-dependent deacylase [Nitrospira sp.]
MRGSDLGILKQKLAAARAVTVLTGAGISADSGVPTFRGSDGLWRNFRAEDLATAEAFARDPRLVWEWYDWRREILATKNPNAAHLALVELEHRIPNFCLITQNVDGLHRMAGSQNICEMHGNIWMVRCTDCGTVGENRHVPIGFPPTCGRCQALLRPHIVWFGETLSSDDLSRCAEALQTCEVLLVIGTSGIVYPAAGFVSVAKAAGAFVAEINLDETAQSTVVDCCLQGRARDLVPLLLEPP